MEPCGRERLSSAFLLLNSVGSASIMNYRAGLPSAKYLPVVHCHAAILNNPTSYGFSFVLRKMGPPDIVENMEPYCFEKMMDHFAIFLRMGWIQTSSKRCKPVISSEMCTHSAICRGTLLY